MASKVLRCRLGHDTRACRQKVQLSYFFRENAGNIGFRLEMARIMIQKLQCNAMFSCFLIPRGKSRKICCDIFVNLVLLIRALISPNINDSEPRHNALVYNQVNYTIPYHVNINIRCDFI